MSIFEHHHDKPEPPKPEPPAHDVPVTHDQPQPPPAHPDGKPDQKSAPQGKAATMLVTDEAVLRNRFFLLWGA